MHFTCYYFKHRCQPSTVNRQPSTVNRRPQCQLLASLPPLLRGRLTHYLNPPTTDTTSDHQRLGTPPSRRPEVGNSLPSLPSLPPLSCFPYPANQATSAASSFVSWKDGTTYTSPVAASKPQHSACLLRYQTVLCITAKFPVARTDARNTQRALHTVRP
jgi:hypothetical protein